MVISLASFAGAIIAPVLYVNNIKTDVALGAQRVDNLEKVVTSMQIDLNQTSKDSAATRAYLEILLPRQGINPRAIITDKSNVNGN